MRKAGKIAVLCASVFVLLAASGCQKKFDPTAFDAGAAAVASASAAASATAPPVDSSAATDATDAGDGLAPLAEGKNTTPHPAVAGGSNAGTKPKAEPEECGMARAWCTTKPAAERGTNQGQKNCKDFRFACFNKGGHL
jgi:hypothetical protein